MGFWSRLRTQPQGLFVRKALFQVHLWLGIALGAYIVMLCLTGSALVLRQELDRAVQTPRPAYEPSRTVLSTDQLREAVLRVYPGYTILGIGDRVRRNNPVIEVRM